MRLYLKLILLLGVAWGAQTVAQRNFEDLDEAQFTFRVLCARFLPGDSEPELQKAAEALCQRRIERFFKELDEQGRREARICAAAAG